MIYPEFWELNVLGCFAWKNSTPLVAGNSVDMLQGAASKTKLPDEWLSRGRGCWTVGLWEPKLMVALSLASGSSCTVWSFGEVEFSAFLGHGYTVGGFFVVCQRPSKWARGRFVYSCLIFLRRITFTCTVVQILLPASFWCLHWLTPEAQGMMLAPGAGQRKLQGWCRRPNILWPISDAISKKMRLALGGPNLNVAAETSWWTYGIQSRWT